MAVKAKSKKDTVKIWLMITLGTGYFYITKKPAKGMMISDGSGIQADSIAMSKTMPP